MQNGKLEISRIDKVGVNMELRKYRTPTGAPDFPELFKIPSDKRIAAMVQKDLGDTIKIITVALTLCFESMNLSRPMSAIQIVDLAEVIADAGAEEDKIAFEDVMLFLQKLSRGEYPGLYEGIDIPKFMERFNHYRDERWAEGIRLRDLKEQEYKNLGGLDMFDREHSSDNTEFGKYLHNYNTRLQAKNDEIKALREERKRNRK